ncbi:hypothetical protein B0I32_102190 [Nonomuraea fuscirosea]|uniref:Uncharacterized protein n=1 Tax=Nonomuraea fuscirosea TaxID=1291556 RepID=A0A2T0N8R0_9ACTN|nr:hypothetical protein [Nonomuraea fuscirosea]PRX69133.1 hypothetical protein B0I32_102190 [Nonomuraea fuscirosea]
MRTPRFVAFDNTCSVVDVPYGDLPYGDVPYGDLPYGDLPYVVLDQEHDDDLARLDLSVDRAVGVLHQMRRELVRLHRARGTAEPELTAVPVQDSAVDGRALTEDLDAADRPDTEAACWLTRWTGRLAKQLLAGPPLVLVHGTHAPQNLPISTRKRPVSAGCAAGGEVSGRTSSNDLP